MCTVSLSQKSCTFMFLPVREVIIIQSETHGIFQGISELWGSVIMLIGMHKASTYWTSRNNHRQLKDLEDLQVEDCDKGKCRYSSKFPNPQFSEALVSPWRSCYYIYKNI